MDNVRKNLENIARQRVKDAKKNDHRAVRKVLEESVVYLKNLINGVRVYDPERVVYIKFLKDCLLEVLKGVEPRKALFLHNEKNAQITLQSRNAKLFYRVGMIYDGLSSKKIETAIKTIAREEKIGEATVRKAWSEHGALTAWKKITEKV